MERTRTPVGAPGWLWVNLAVAAMGFSLVHTLVDFVGMVLGSRFDVQQRLLSVLIGVLYTWWAWVFAKAVRGAKSGLVGLMAFDVLWVGGNALMPAQVVPILRTSSSLSEVHNTRSLSAFPNRHAIGLPRAVVRELTKHRPYRS